MQYQIPHVYDTAAYTWEDVRVSWIMYGPIAIKSAHALYMYIVRACTFNSSAHTCNCLVYLERQDLQQQIKD